MKRRDFFQRASIAGPAVILTSCATVADLALRSQYLIRTDQILNRLGPLFPFSRSVGGVGSVALSNPVFAMAPEKNKVRIGLTTAATTGYGLSKVTGIPALDQLGGRSATGNCLVACGLRYDRRTRGIYLRDPEVERLELDRLSPALTNPMRHVVNLFGPQLLDKHPIHTLEPSLATRFIDSMEVQPGGIALKFSPLG